MVKKQPTNQRLSTPPEPFTVGGVKGDVTPGTPAATPGSTALPAVRPRGARHPIGRYGL
ncbi:hypothetical protein GCM10018963_08290 [Saccharothrix longispora]